MKAVSPVLKALFLADVHLRNQEESVAFANYLKKQQGKYSHLYILGDLFDYWLGPKNELVDEFQPVLQTLQEMTRSGMKIFFIHGNRDFLIDHSFTEKYGVQIHPDYHLAELSRNCRVLLTHGDLLCTSDHKYRLYRSVIRSGIVRFLAVHLPLSLTNSIALKLKKTSKRSIAIKKVRQISINLNFVKELLQSCDFLICGHVHEKMDFRLKENPNKGFMVLGGWDNRGSVIEYLHGKFSFQDPEWR